VTSRFVPAHAPRGLEVQLHPQPRRLHVRLCGELDIATADRLAAPDLLRPDDRTLEAVLLDLRQLAFCDVSGTRALVSYRDAHHDLGRVVAAHNLRPNVLAALRALEVAHLFLPGSAS